jgi:hypothetical protein
MTPTIIITATPEGYLLTLKRLTRDNFGDAIASLKRTVPPHLREYEPDTKQWFVADAARTQLDRWLGHLFVTHGVEAEWLTSDDAGERARKPHTSAKADPFATLHLLPTAPMEVVRAAYKALAMKHHPDLGGDTQAMQRLNQAYRELAA